MIFDCTSLESFAWLAEVDSAVVCLAEFEHYCISRQLLKDVVLPNAFQMSNTIYFQQFLILFLYAISTKICSKSGPKQ